jgi:hypothetical protein
MQQFIDVSYRSQEHMLVARWIQQMRTDTDFAVGYHYLLHKAQEHNCPFWLLDVRRCPPNCARQAQWLLEAFCPLVASAFNSGPIYGAHLVFPSHQLHYTSTVLPILAHLDNHHYKVAVFIEEGPTISWLHGQQPASSPSNSVLSHTPTPQYTATPLLEQDLLGA